jgi:DNA-binding HxlR family transcriptional regulator
MRGHSLDRSDCRGATIHESLLLCKRYTDGVKRTSLSDHPCSIARTLDVAGEWWTPLILRDVAYGVRRFAEIQEDLGISANVLSERLDGLLAEGMLERRVYQQRPQRHEYHLTDKGADLIPALLALMQWGDRWKWPGGRGPVSVTHEHCGHEVRVEVRCEHCEREARASELRASARARVVKAPAQGEPGSVSAGRLVAGGGGGGVSLER